MKYTYRVLGHDDPDERVPFESSSYDSGFIAEGAAEHYHDHGSGWEVGWPVEFAVYDQEGSLLGTFRVEREMVPSFIAYLPGSPGGLPARLQ